MHRVFTSALLLLAAAYNIAAIGGVVPTASAPASTTLTSFSLVNTTGSTVNTIISPFIGLQFKKGDLPSGTPWPKFIRDDTSANCPYSYGLIRTWSDGSIKHMTVVVRCPSTIAGSATLKVDVQTAGTQPTASVRTTTELSAANIQMIGVGAVNLSGTWNATVADAITNGVCNAWINGDAGKGWICDGDYKQSGSAHGQLRTRWYTFLATDGSGNLGGVRYLSRTWQPYYDIDSPAKATRAFSSLTACTGTTSTSCSGGTSVALSFPYLQENFTWNSGDVTCAANGTDTNAFTVTGNNYYTGIPGGGGYNVVPVLLTNPPTGLSAGTIYYANSSSVTGAKVCLFTGPSAGTGDAPASAAGSGTHVMTPTLIVQHFGSIFNATSAGTYNYCQCGGSLTADATLRFTKDTTYWHATKVLPPWNTGLSAAAGVASWPYVYDPNTIGPLLSNVGAPGSRTIIGPLPGQAALHFFKQDVNGELVIRTMGLTGANTNVAIRQGTGATMAPPDVGDPALHPTGFTASNYATTFIYSNDNPTNNSFPVGTVPPVQSTTTFSSLDFSHFSSLAYYPYLWSGEPQYLDIMYEIANDAILERTTGDFRNPAVPPGLSSHKYGIVTALPNQTRAGAWKLRDTIHAAGIAPDTSPDGVAWQTYFMALANNDLAWLNTTIAQTNSWASTNGYHAFRCFDPGYSPCPFTLPDNSLFQEMYLLMAADYGAALLESSDALTFANNKATWFTHQTATWGDWQRAGYYELMVTDDNAANPITSDTQWANNISGALSWSSSTNLFTIDTNTGDVYNNYAPANGDKYIFTGPSSQAGFGSGTIPGGLTEFTPYYTCNTTNTSGTIWTFKLATATNCSTIPTLTTTTSTFFEGTFFTAVTQPSTGTAIGDLTEEGYVSELYGAGLWAQAIGASSNINHAVSDASSRLTGGGGYNCTTTITPEFCMQSSY